MMQRLLMQRRALLRNSLLALAAWTTRAGAAQASASQPASSQPSTPAPPAAPAALQADLAATERALGLSFTEAERQQLAADYGRVLETLARIRKLELPNDLAPALRFDPRLPGKQYTMPSNSIRGTAPAAGPLPASRDEIALAPAWKLAAWLKGRQISSVELTRLYLERIAQLGSKLENYITVTEQLALEQAASADAELARGRIRSPLHGVPYGLKDLFDVAGVRTTWGAEPFKERIATRDAAIVEKLTAAGAVLLGKTAVGALAYGDIWYGGTSRNPWNPQEGSSGSSAGSASAAAAGLAGFAIGTETLGSIVSPSHRCGTAGLRPTFGRISRRGGMALCWSWDKVGALGRSVADCALAVSVLNGADAEDAGSLAAPFGWDWQARPRALRIGYVPAWFEGENVTEVERRALEAARSLGASMVEVSLPELPYDALTQLVLIEAAAAFSELTLGNRDDELKWQSDAAWPNTWRRTRLFPAVEAVQLERLRRRVMQAYDTLFTQIDVLIGPPYAGGALAATNATGHPCLVLKAGFVERPTRASGDAPLDPNGPRHRVPRVIALWAGLFREDLLISTGRALEAALGLADEHPPLARLATG